MALSGFRHHCPSSTINSAGEEERIGDTQHCAPHTQEDNGAIENLFATEKAPSTKPLISWIAGVMESHSLVRWLLSLLCAAKAMCTALCIEPLTATVAGDSCH